MAKMIINIDENNSITFCLFRNVIGENTMRYKNVWEIERIFWD